MNNKNKIIVINTIVMYIRLIITTIVGLLTSRFVLQALGASDFGLYSVVGGIVTMLGVINAAMHTTTRRYINVEMGKIGGNMNRIFNISLLLHYGFALFIFFLAETIGMYYIYNFLNVSSDKLADAIFVFQVSTIAAAISIVNVPYQALMQAFEKFTQVAIFDILTSVSKLVFVLWLLVVDGNILRIYAVGMSGLTILSLLLYYVACKLQWKDIIKFNFYKESQMYKEILCFNNYVALGATSYLGRTQGSTILINFFFGTIVNAAFAIGYTVESFCSMFVNNIGSAAVPQITQNYSDNNKRSIYLTEVLNKFSIFLMLLIVVPLSLEMDFVLRLWLKEVPDGAALICRLTLINALARRLFGGLDNLVQASGKIKWFQILGSIMEVLSLPISFLFFRMGFPAYSVLVVCLFMTIVGAVVTFFLMSKILNFNVYTYSKHVLLPSTIVIMFLFSYSYLYSTIKLESFSLHICGMAVCFIVTIISILFFGLNNYEHQLINRVIVSKFISNKK